MATTDDMPTEDLTNVDETLPDTKKSPGRFKGPTKEEIQDAIDNVDTTNLERVSER